MIELNRNPSARDLKWFGLLLLAFFGLLAAMALWRFDAPSGARRLLAVGAALSVVYYAVPPLRRWIFLAWMFAAFPIGWTISHVLLFVVYFVVITPVGLVLRLFGKDPPLSSTVRMCPPPSSSNAMRIRPSFRPARPCLKAFERRFMTTFSSLSASPSPAFCWPWCWPSLPSVCSSRIT